MHLEGYKTKLVLKIAVTFMAVAGIILTDCAWAQAFRNLHDGDVAPGFKLMTVSGQEVEYAAPPEVAVILSFVKMGQDKSDAVMRELARLDPKVMEKTQILTLVINPQEGNVAGWVKNLGVTFPVLMDKNEEVYSKYGVMVAPQTAIITPEGKLKGEIGGHTAEFKRELEAKLREVLGMPPVEDVSAAVGKDLSPERRKALRELQKAQVMIKRKMKSKAIPQIKEAVASDDTFAEAHILLAETLLDEGGPQNLADAEKHLNRVGELEPNNAGVKIGQARIKALKGDVEGAVSALEAIAKVTPKSGKIYYYIGRMQQDAGKHDKAAEAYRHAAEKFMESEN